MSILLSILVVIETVACFLLISIVLVQKAKSEGLGLAFGAGMGETLFGARAGNVLTKGTVILGCVFMVNTVALAILYSESDQKSLIQEHIEKMSPITAAPSTFPAELSPLDGTLGGPVDGSLEQAPAVEIPPELETPSDGSG